MIWKEASEFNAAQMHNQILRYKIHVDYFSLKLISKYSDYTVNDEK